MGAQPWGSSEVEPSPSAFPIDDLCPPQGLSSVSGPLSTRPSSGQDTIFLEGEHLSDTPLEETDESGGKLGGVSQQPPPTFMSARDGGAVWGGGALGL